MRDNTVNGKKIGKSAGKDENGNGLLWMFYKEYINKEYDKKSYEEILQLESLNVELKDKNTNKELAYTEWIQPHMESSLLIDIISFTNSLDISQHSLIPL